VHTALGFFCILIMMWFSIAIIQRNPTEIFWNKEERFGGGEVKIAPNKNLHQGSSSTGFKYGDEMKTTRCTYELISSISYSFRLCILAPL